MPRAPTWVASATRSAPRSASAMASQTHSVAACEFVVAPPTDEIPTGWAGTLELPPFFCTAFPHVDRPFGGRSSFFELDELPTTRRASGGPIEGK